MHLLQKGYLRVSGLHSIYYELRGKKDGVPAVFLHGGPGSRFKPKHFKNFPPNHQVLFFDQRGCGRSRPFGELKENKTKELVEDIAKLMDHLGFKKAKIVGGSWGYTLAMCFAIKYPHRVKKLVIGGIYLGTKEEAIEMMRIFRLFSPKLYEESKRTPSFFKKLDSSMVQRLHMLEYSIMRNEKTWNDIRLGKVKKSDWIEIHYIRNDCFMPPDYIMKNLYKIKHIPTVIIQGQQDLVCPPISAWNISKIFKKKKLIIVPGGHSLSNAHQLFRKYI